MRRGRGGAVELVLDGGVDAAAKRGTLHLFVDGKKPPEDVAFVGIAGV